MNVYTYSEARQKLASVLDQAACAGQVRIRRKDGQMFVIRPEQRKTSPLDVEALDLDFGADEIVELVREGRRTEYQTAAERCAYVVAPEGGEAILRGTQITVAAVLDELASGPGPDAIVRARPALTREAVVAAILYAAEQLRR